MKKRKKVTTQKSKTQKIIPFPMKFLEKMEPKDDTSIPIRMETQYITYYATKEKADSQNDID